MRRKTSSGFVMADSLIALGMVTLMITSILLWQHQLLAQQQVHMMRLKAARIAKESSDQSRAERHKARIKRENYTAVANRDEVTVWYQDKLVLRVRNNEKISWLYNH